MQITTEICDFKLLLLTTLARECTENWPLMPQECLKNASIMPHRCHLMHGQNLSGAWPEPRTGLKSVGDASLTLDVDECLRKSDQIAFSDLIHGLSDLGIAPSSMASV